MITEVARYGKLKYREEPVQANDGVVKVVDTVSNHVSKQKSDNHKLDKFDPFAMYYFDVDFSDEVNDDEFDIFESDSKSCT